MCIRIFDTSRGVVVTSILPHSLLFPSPSTHRHAPSIRPSNDPSTGRTVGFSELSSNLLVLVTGNGKYADFPDASVSGPDRLRTSSSLLPRGRVGWLSVKNFLTVRDL